MNIKFAGSDSLTQYETHTTATEVLKETFSDVRINGYKYTENEIWDVLLYASVNRLSVNSACADLKNAPSPNWLYGMLDHALFQKTRLEELERKGNQMLQTTFPKRLTHARQRIAIDLVCLPFYGSDATPYIYRSAAKQSTTKFYCYASAYVIRKHKRVTLPLTFVRPDETLFVVLQRLLQHIQALQIPIKRLDVDRAFARVDIFLYLEQQAYLSVVPLPKKGKTLKELQAEKKSSQRSYTMKSQQYGEITLTLYIACKYRKGRHNKHGTQVLVFAVLGQALCTNTELQIAQEYTDRFGIETSYRVMNRVRATTTSLNPKFRLLLVMMAFFLVNLWVWCKWHLTLKQRQHSHRQLTFTLMCFASFLRHAIESVYHIITCLKL